MREVDVVVSMEAFHMASPVLQMSVPTTSPALQEALAIAAVASSVPGPIEGEESEKLL
jgi:hypothetical protein